MTGRQELLTLIKKTKNKEILLSTLLSTKKKGLRNSKLGVKFHVDDLLGNELAISIDTASGPIIRLNS